MTEDDPGFALYTEAMGALFARHPLRESVAGTRGSIAAISPETLYACHKAFYVPSNMCLAVCGDVDPEHAAEAAALCSPQGRAARLPRQARRPLTRRKSPRGAVPRAV